MSMVDTNNNLSKFWLILDVRFTKESCMNVTHLNKSIWGFKICFGCSAKDSVDVVDLVCDFILKETKAKLIQEVSLNKLTEIEDVDREVFSFYKIKNKKIGNPEKDQLWYKSGKKYYYNDILEHETDHQMAYAA
jgi:hypothetical protein